MHTDFLRVTVAISVQTLIRTGKGLAVVTEAHGILGACLVPSLKHANIGNIGGVGFNLGIGSRHGHNNGEEERGDGSGNLHVIDRFHSIV